MGVLRIGALLAFAAALAGCAHHQPVWSRETVIHIPGKAGARLSPEDASRRMLAEAARVTVDHGRRCFAPLNVSPSRPGLSPGADLNIRLLSACGPGALDAYRLLEAPGPAS